MCTQFVLLYSYLHPFGVVNFIESAVGEGEALRYVCPFVALHLRQTWQFQNSGFNQHSGVNIYASH